MNDTETTRILRMSEARQLAPHKTKKCGGFGFIRALSALFPRFSAAQLFVAVRALAVPRRLNLPWR